MGAPEAISESRSSLRGLLWDFRDKARHSINQLRGELSRTAQAFERLLDSMSTPEAMLVRWSEKEYLVSHPAARQLTQTLSGAYACQQGPKSAHPAF